MKSLGQTLSAAFSTFSDALVCRAQVQGAKVKRLRPSSFLDLVG